MNTLQETSAQVVQPRTVKASWQRDEAYLLEAVRFSFFDRTPVQRFVVPLMAGLAVFLWFSPAGFMPLIFGVGLRWFGAGIVLGGCLVLISSWATYRTALKVSRKGYNFVGDTARWEFSDQEVSYQVDGYSQGACEGTTRHKAHSQWSWYSALSFSDDGLRLHRTATEAYVIPVRSLNAQDSREALQQITTMARKAGLIVRSSTASHWPTTFGCILMLGLVLLLVMTYGAMFAALPYLRYGAIEKLWFSGIETFWWIAFLASPCLVGGHFLLSKGLSKMRVKKSTPILIFHTSFGLLWGFLLLCLLQASKTWIFDEALADSNFFALFPFVMIILSSALSAQLLSVHGATIWSALFNSQHSDDL